MYPFDFESDAKRVCEMLFDGGIAVIPTTVGYVILGATTEAIRRIIEAKRRAPAKLNAMIGCKGLHEELHDVNQRSRDVVETITETYDLPLGTVAPARLDHAMLAGLDGEVLARTTDQGTVAMLINAGPLLNRMAEFSLEAAIPVIGSSANVTLQGTKFRLADIESEVLEIADIALDYGLLRWNCYGRSSTMINVDDFTVVRHGVCFDLIADALWRHFGIDLAPEQTG